MKLAYLTFIAGLILGAYLMHLFQPKSETVVFEPTASFEEPALSEDVMESSPPPTIPENDENLPVAENNDQDMEVSETELTEPSEPALEPPKIPAELAEYQALLAKEPLDNPREFAYKARRIETLEEYDRVAGQWQGEFFPLDGSAAHQVEVNSDFQNLEGKLSGKISIILTKDGEVYSHKRGNGNNDDIREGPNGSFILATSPTTFMHLFSTENGPLLGHLYRDDTLMGYVILRKI